MWQAIIDQQEVGFDMLHDSQSFKAVCNDEGMVRRLLCNRQRKKLSNGGIIFYHQNSFDRSSSKSCFLIVRHGGNTSVTIGKGHLRLLGWRTQVIMQRRTIPECARRNSLLASFTYNHPSSICI